jgi:hypothetical protein
LSIGIGQQFLDKYKTMPRLSLYNPVKSNNYKFLDRTIKEQFWIGGTDLLIHKYLGPKDTGSSRDLTQPQITKPDPTVIQDLLFMENRDRSYSPDVYRLRGHYNVQNLDFDLTQFGLFLTNDVIFVTVHFNEMIDLIGRKLMVGDVFELPHLTDYHPLNDTIPVGLRRYYQITDANYASEGFSQTWYPHLWRVKCEPLVNSREFSDILNKPTNVDNFMGDWNKDTAYTFGYVVSYGGKNYTVADASKLPPAGTLPTDTAYWMVDAGSSLKDLISNYNKNIAINDAVLAEAARVVPSTGVDRSQLYIVPTSSDNTPQIPINIRRRDGGTQFGPGTLTVVQSARYKTPSTVIRFKNSQIQPGHRVILSTGVTASDKNDTKSGRVFGDQVLTLNLGNKVTGPYGTSDNVYATADQYINSAMTTRPTAALTNVIRVLSIPSDVSVGILIRIAVTTANGTVQQALPDGTRITRLDRTNNTVTVTNNTLISIPEGLQVDVAYDFSNYYVTISTADGNALPANSFFIPLISVDGLTVGDKIRGTHWIGNRSYDIFAPNTKITGIDVDKNQIRVSSGTKMDLPDLTGLQVKYDVLGEATSKMSYRSDADPRFQFIRRASPRNFGYTATVGAGDGTAPNGEPTGKGIVFPVNPTEGDYFLRTDYSPQKLFRWSGQLWVQISENIQTTPGFGAGSTNQKAGFLNNTGTVTLADGSTIPSRQSLSDGMRIQPD